MLSSFNLSRLARYMTIALTCVVFSFATPRFASGSEAEVTNFNAKYHIQFIWGIPYFAQKLDYSYRLSWAGNSSDRTGKRNISWHENNFFVQAINFAVHDTSVVSSGSDTVAPVSEGTGNYFKIVVKISDVVTPQIIYASDTKTDGNFAN